MASITFVPFLDGYFKEALDVIDVHLHSLRQTVAEDIDLLVFDNGSCDELKEFLTTQHHSGVIDWLFLSKQNLGKTGALNWIFSAMPNEFIVFTDSDVLFRPGWMQRSLEIFDSFDQVGIVSAQPAFFDGIPGVAEAAKQLAENKAVQISDEQPDPGILAEYCDGIGASDDVYQRLLQNRLKVATNQTSGVGAVVGTTHMQFMLRRELARKLVPLPATMALDPADDFDINRRMEALGYLQLSLPDPLVYHLGNSLKGRNTAEVDQVRLKGVTSLNITDSTETSIRRDGFLKTLLSKAAARSSTINRFIQRIYSLLFDVLYSDSK
ncbi:MAG: glycosyltransferase [Anaerolineales bacterium]|nr:glycosyltransferase [Chloroflexota bacterium]MBL6979863.1 glycosyltransferase [Anaerolineales bacterium]